MSDFHPDAAPDDSENARRVIKSVEATVVDFKWLGPTRPSVTDVMHRIERHATDYRACIFIIPNFRKRVEESIQRLYSDIDKHHQRA